METLARSQHRPDLSGVQVKVLCDDDEDPPNWQTVAPDAETRADLTEEQNTLLREMIEEYKIKERRIEKILSRLSKIKNLIVSKLDREFDNFILDKESPEEKLIILSKI
ncbi:uncharacterized protein GIQ15_01942 [Arthroderma uncinatum]|uniref:uncharacterized protein n=1 Tax=Arthroderma uncinatum TaxID=74035 RepID=UPI00144AB55D|nr:uncharacterized protein GIQ15_01942 [Arthroderma uncinatum]KAF3492425.1 hypothetical protein GIQ15_01942 [Arthroderma uncinatum]